MRTAVNKVFILIVGIGASFFGGPFPIFVQAADSMVEFRGGRFSTCVTNQTRCLSVTSKKGNKSLLKPLYTFNEVSFVIEDENQVFEKGKGLKAIYDSHLNQMTIISVSESGTITERVVDLLTLKTRIFVVN